jgi:hypothetical protein
MFDCQRLTEVISEFGKVAYAKAGAGWLQLHMDRAMIKDQSTLSKLIKLETGEELSKAAISQYLSATRTISPEKVIVLTRFFYSRHRSANRTDEFPAFPSPTDSALLVLYQAAHKCLKEVVSGINLGVGVSMMHTFALWEMQSERWLRIKRRLMTDRQRAAELAREISLELLRLSQRLGIRPPDSPLMLDDLLQIEADLGKHWLKIHRCLTGLEAD